MNLRKIWIFLIWTGTLALLSCSNKEITSEKNDKSQKEKKQEQTEIESTKKLNSDSAVEFFLKYGEKNTERRVVIHTEFGDITIELFEDKPVHRANFIYLVKQHYFNTTWFHRVSKGHVVQGGNSDSQETAKSRKNIGAYSLPAEMNGENYHQYGAVAAARSYKRNPNKKSNPFEFYISLGQKFSLGQLRAMEEKYGKEFNKEQIELYQKTGGSPHLDREHTVFGRVVKGMDVVEKISMVEVDSGEWPLNNVPISMEVLSN